MAAQESIPSKGISQALEIFVGSVLTRFQMARAGFFYQPTSSCPDNTTCYLCKSNLDGWEENDNAVEEHLKHSPDCGWAITIATELEIEYGSQSQEDPMSEKMLDARRMTFGSQWPHENKRGWICKTQKVCPGRHHHRLLSLIENADDRGRMVLLPHIGERRLRQVFVL